MSRPVALTLMVAIAIAAFFAGRMSPSDQDRDATPRAPTAAEIDRPTQAAYDNLFEKFEETERTNQLLRGELEKARERPPVEVIVEEPLPETASSEPRFVFEEQSEVLKQIDWAAVGLSFKELPPLLSRLHRALDEGKSPIEVEGIGDLQRWNGPLLNEAGKIHKAGLSGTGVNGSFTHPALIANQVYAALASTDQKLTESQIEQLRTLGDQFIAAEATRVAGYNDATYGLTKVIEECALKDRMYAAIDAMVTPGQLALLHPEDVRGYTQGDLFCSGMVWLQVARPVGFVNRADLSDRLSSMLIAKERVPAAHHELFRSIVTEWVNALPDALLAEPLSPRAGSGMMQVGHITAASHEMLKLRQALATRVPDEAFQARIKQGAHVAVPYRRVAK